MPEKKQTNKPKKSVYSIELKNPTPEQLIQMGFASLVNPDKNFTPNKKPNDYNNSNTCLDIPRTKKLSINNNVFREFSKKYTKKNPNKLPSDDDSYNATFIAQKFLEKTLGGNKNLLEYNKKFNHQGALHNNTEDFSIQPNKKQFLAFSGISLNIDITTENNTQETTNTSFITEIIPYGKVENTSDYIQGSYEEPVAVIKNTFKKNADGTTTVPSIKIEFFNEEAAQLYKKEITPGNDRKRIEDIIKSEINLDDNSSLKTAIENANINHPLYDMLDDNYQSNYLKDLIVGLKKYAKENEASLKEVTSILNKIGQFASLNQSETITTKYVKNARSESYYYLKSEALLKGKLKPKTPDSKIKKYNSLYKSLYNKDLQDESIESKVTAVLNSYHKQSGISNFFNIFRHNKKEIETLVQAINEPKQTNESTLEKTERIRNSIFNTIETLCINKNFNVHGETAQIASFLVDKLDTEIAELKKQAQSTNKKCR